MLLCFFTSISRRAWNYKHNIMLRGDAIHSFPSVSSRPLRLSLNFMMHGCCFVISFCTAMFLTIAIPRNPRSTWNSPTQLLFPHPFFVTVLIKTIQKSTKRFSTKGCKVWRSVGVGTENKSNRRSFSSAFLALRIFFIFYSEFPMKKKTHQRGMKFLWMPRSKTVGFTMDFSTCDNVAIVSKCIFRGY